MSAFRMSSSYCWLIVKQEQLVVTADIVVLMLRNVLQKYTPWVKKKPRHYTLVHSFTKYWPIFKILSPFRLGKKLAIKQSLKIPPHLKCVATLPCEILEFKNRSNSVSQWWCQSAWQNWVTTSLIFVYPGVKVNGAYYHDVLLSQQLLPAICQVSGKFLIIQQDSASAHRACETINLLQRETPRPARFVVA